MAWIDSQETPNAALVRSREAAGGEVRDAVQRCSAGDWTELRVRGWGEAAERLEELSPAFGVVEVAGFEGSHDRAAEVFGDLWRRVPFLFAGEGAERELGRLALECGAIGAFEREIFDTGVLEVVFEREVGRRRSVEQAERKSRGVEFLREGVVICESEGDLPIVYCNERFLELTGYDESEVLGRNCRFLQCDETSEEAVAEIRAGLDAEQSIQTVLRNARRSGEVFWNELSISPVPDDSGEVVEFIGFQRDVTPRIEIGEELERYRLAVETAPFPVFLKDLEGRYELANRATLEYLEASREEVIGTLDDDLVDEEVARTWREHERAAVEEGDSVERVMEIDMPVGERIFHVIRVPYEKEGTIEGTLGVAHDITERRRLKREMEEQSLYDQVTGLLNRSGLHDRVEPVVERAVASDETVAVGLVDLDDFDAVNQSFGRKQGDWLLKRVAERMREALGPEAELARIGGDEFAMLLEPCEGSVEFEECFERLAAAFEEPFELESTQTHVSFSLGFAALERCPESEVRVDSILRRLVRAAYRAAINAKAVRGKSWRVARPDREEWYDARIEFENRIRRGLEQGEFLPYFQPIFEIAGGALWALEILVRWDHPEKGFVSPGRFIPVAERSGLLDAITDVLIRRTGELLRDVELPPGTEPPIQINLNLSPGQIARRGLADRLRAHVDEHLPDRATLSLEITEGQLLERKETVERLRDVGFRILVDDFGTGHSSLTRIKTLPMDELKLDMEFVHGATDNAGDRAILETVTELGRQLGVPVTGEGVETEQQLELLRASGCRAAQGYMLGRPSPLEETLSKVGP